MFAPTMADPMIAPTMGGQNGWAHEKNYVNTPRTDAPTCQYVRTALPQPVVPAFEQPILEPMFTEPYPRPQYVYLPPKPQTSPKIVFVGPSATRVVPPQNVVIPLESEIVCRGHPHDRQELCFGCSIPPRQLKFDLVRVETSGFLGLGICKGQRIKAVCRKCRATMPPCRTCGRQSVIEHP